jgi:hypothetical protein
MCFLLSHEKGTDNYIRLPVDGLLKVSYRAPEYCAAVSAGGCKKFIYGVKHCV